MGQLLRYRAMRGAFVDVRVGALHGAWCLACCWALMVLLVVFGVMNLVAMTIVTAVIVAEKVLTSRRWFSIAVGVLVLALAVGVAARPRWAPGLRPQPGMSAMQSTQAMPGGH
jgi:predicted metal-binding membrane protein